MLPPVNTAEIALAQAVLAVLDLQQRYFQTKNPTTLTESKAAERALRKRCTAILHPENVQGELFDLGGESGT